MNSPAALGFQDFYQSTRDAAVSCGASGQIVNDHQLRHEADMSHFPFVKHRGKLHRRPQTTLAAHRSLDYIPIR